MVGPSVDLQFLCKYVSGFDFSRIAYYFILHYIIFMANIKVFTKLGSGPRASPTTLQELLQIKGRQLRGTPRPVF